MKRTRYKEEFIDFLLIIQLILFLLASITAVVALLFWEPLPFVGCLICNAFVCRNVILINDIIPRK